MNIRSRRGTGTITKQGYRRICINGKTKAEHTLIWESHNGPVPAGFGIHHKNGDRLDNNIENLELVDPHTHKRIHTNIAPTVEITKRSIVLGGKRHSFLKQEAERIGITVSDLIRRIIDQYLEDRK